MEQQNKVEAAEPASEPAENTTRVMFIDPTDIPGELREQFKSLFGIPLADKVTTNPMTGEELGDLADALQHRRRSTDKVASKDTDKVSSEEFRDAMMKAIHCHLVSAIEAAVEKPSIEKEKATAAKVLRAVADKQGLCFTNKEIDALTLLGDTFSPNFAALCADLACYRFRKQGWV